MHNTWSNNIPTCGVTPLIYIYKKIVIPSFVLVLLKSRADYENRWTSHRLQQGTKDHSSPNSGIFCFHKQGQKWQKKLLTDAKQKNLNQRENFCPALRLFIQPSSYPTRSSGSPATHTHFCNTYTPVSKFITLSGSLPKYTCLLRLLPKTKMSDIMCSLVQNKGNKQQNKEKNH